VRAMKPVQCLALVAAVAPLAACSWFPSSTLIAVGSGSAGPPPDKLVVSCGQALGDSGPLAIPVHVRGPVLKPRAVRRTFARAGLTTQSLSVGFFFRGSGAPRPKSYFGFRSFAEPNRATSGTVAVFASDAGALAVLRSYGPHKPGDCSTNLRIGNVFIQRTGSIDSRLAEAIRRLHAKGR